MNVDSPRPVRGKLMIVEPAPLLRWSLATYLARWFEVFVAKDRPDAEKLLEHQPMDALVISDDFSSTEVGEIEVRARRGNSRVHVVHTVTDQPPGDMAANGGDYLEKPFELASLASLLGIDDSSPNTP